MATWRDSLVKDTENGLNDTTLSPTKRKAEHTLEVLTNKCDDLMKNDGSYYVSNVIYDKNGCSDSSAYLVQHVPGETDTVISYIDTLLKIILPTVVSLIQLFLSSLKSTTAWRETSWLTNANFASW